MYCLHVNGVSCPAVFLICTALFLEPFLKLRQMLWFFFAGKLVEYDKPMNLMEREGSLFGQLVKEYWSHYQSAESH